MYKSKARNKKSESTALPVVARKDRLLGDLLTNLAVLLTTAGYSFSQFQELAKTCFVAAASKTSRLRNGRLNQSQIAARTGLTRSDVKRIVASNPDRPTAKSNALQPVLRVIEGWRTDPAFLTKKGLPSRLRTRKPNSEFGELVRLYGGDIPERSVMRELQRRELIVVRGGFVRLVSSPASDDRGKVESVTLALSEILADVNNAPSKKRIAHYQAQLQANSDVELRLLRARTAENVGLFLAGLEAAERGVRSARPTNTRSKHLRVSVVVTDSGDVNDLADSAQR